MKTTRFFLSTVLTVAAILGCAAFFVPEADANNAGNVYITRFWHNHQPIYWPEWNSGVGQDLRVQYAHDSMRLKPTQNYGAPWNHPHNNLEEIFGNHDRIAAYQGRPRDSVANVGQAGGYAQSFTGSLIDNIRNLAANGWNYGGDWNSGNTQARQWTTPSGGPRMDMVGFAYHHSLTPLLPKEVLRKEIQIFKQAWWKAWGGNMDLSDHSKGFFPTEMAYSRDIIDVLVDEGYEWVIVPSHHISRTSPSYNDHVNPEGTFNIYSSPPNKADQVGPRFDNASQWWYSEPNPGQGAWNVSPFAYQLHRVKYVDPNTGAEKTMIAVPSDDVLSYQAGYSGAQIGLVDGEITPHAGDGNRPVLVMPATDGDNAWGGGHESWMNSTPGFFGAAQSRGYKITTIQDFVNQFKAHAPTTHIEEGAWIYPEMCYGSPYFLKWIEPPVRQNPNSPTIYPNTQIDVENGWSLKFFAYAPKMAGANWVITAEQIMRAQGGDVQAWKIQAPYDWDGSWTSPNEVELAWHIYLKGLDSGFQYYGGLGNDDEVKPGLAARRTIETLQDYMSTRMHLDQTGPTVLKPQRFPYNPGGWTFGWFNRVPQGDENFLKKMPSQFYVWSLVHDVSGVQSVDLMIRRDKDGVRSLDNNHNLTYAGGSDVEDWVRIPMTRRILPNTRSELNALAGHGEIDYVVTSPQIADQYFIQIDDSVLPGFRGNLFDYYIEAVDTRGNITRTDIQHVFVEDDGVAPSSSAQFSSDPRDCAPLTVTYNAANGPLEGVSPVYMQIQFDGGGWTRHQMTASGANVWTYTIEIPGKPASASVWFENAAGDISDSRNGQNWTTSIRDCDAPVGPRIVTWDPQHPDGCVPVTIRYYPNEGPLQGSAQINIHIGRNGWVGTETLPMTQHGIYWEYTFETPDETYQINMVFNNGTLWDNNGGQDWNVAVINCSEEGPLPTVSTVPAAPDGCDPVTIRYNPIGRPLSSADPVYIHIGRNGWQNTIEPNPAMTWEGNHWSYTYDPAPGTEVLNFVFNDGSGSWDNNQDNDWFVNIANCEEGPVIPTGLAITNPPANVSVAHEVATTTLSGIADGVVSDISWTNARTGASGSFPAASPWTLADVALGVGANLITVRSEVPGSGGDVTLAQDNVSAYSGGWSSGDNRGTGFGPWALTGSDNAGHFPGEIGFGFWSHEGGNTAEAVRPFAEPLAVGQTFRVRMQNGWIWEDGGSVGVALRNAGGDILWEIYFNGGDEFYTTSDGVTDIAYTDAGLDIAFTLTGAGAYSVTVQPVGGSLRTYSGAFSGTISQFRAWSSNNGTGDGQNSNRDYFVNNLAITAPGTGGNDPVSASVTITRQPGGETGPLVITVPASDISVPNSVALYTLQGLADTSIQGHIRWTNDLTGLSGNIPAVANWTIPNLTLGVGANLITVRAQSIGPGGVIAEDDASDPAYSDGAFPNGSNGGTGFQPWELFANENAGHFSGPNGFGFWSHEGGNLAQAVRPFSSPLAVGQTFHIRMQNGWIWEEGGSVGVALRDADGDMLWEFYFNGGDAHYSRSGGETDISWTDQGLDIAFKLTGAGTYQATVQPVGGAARQYIGEISGTIAQLRAWSYNNGTDDGENSNRDFFVNTIAITSDANGGDPHTASVTITRQTEDPSAPPVIENVVLDASGNSLDVALAETIAGAEYALYECEDLLAVPQVWTRLETTVQIGDGGALVLEIPELILPRNNYRIGVIAP